MEPYRLRIIPRRWTSRLASSVAALAFFTVFFAAHNACAQTGGTSSDTTQVTWPHTLTLGFGGAGNLNWQISGTAGTGNSVDPDGMYGYTQSTPQFKPEFHIMAEIPISSNWMFAPRIAFNSLGLNWKNASSTSPTASVAPNPAVPLNLSISDIGVDVLMKYVFSNFHLLGGFNLSVPIEAMSYDHGTGTTPAGTTGNLPTYSKFLAGLKVGAGYDIPLNAGNSIWMTPEVFFTYPLTDYASNAGFTTYPATLSVGVTVKFGLGNPPPPPPPAVPTTATITAHGVMPDGSPTNDLVSPQQATHSRSSVPLLPYIFFDEGSAVIPSRYSTGGASGFQRAIGARRQERNAGRTTKCLTSWVIE